jgi:hypothetical protein
VAWDGRGEYEIHNPIAIPCHEVSAANRRLLFNNGMQQKKTRAAKRKVFASVAMPPLSL